MTFFSTQDNLTRTIDDDEIIIPKIQQATQHYCEKNNCDDLPATQVLKVKVIISITIEKYKFRGKKISKKSKQFLKKFLRF